MCNSCVIYSVIIGFAAFAGYEFAMVPGSLSIMLGAITLGGASRR